MSWLRLDLLALAALGDAAFADRAPCAAGFGVDCTGFGVAAAGFGGGVAAGFVGVAVGCAGVGCAAVFGNVGAALAAGSGGGAA